MGGNIGRLGSLPLQEKLSLNLWGEPSKSLGQDYGPQREDAQKRPGTNKQSRARSRITDCWSKYYVGGRWAPAQRKLLAVSDSDDYTLNLKYTMSASLMM